MLPLFPASLAYLLKTYAYSILGDNWQVIVVILSEATSHHVQHLYMTGHGDRDHPIFAYLYTHSSNKAAG
jgi:hypothetical protein